MGADSDGKGGSGSGAITAPPTPATPSICADDIQIDASVVQIYSEKAPLPVSPAIVKARGKKTTDDYKAVWACVPKPPDPSVLIFFHGNSHYVTVGPIPPPPTPQEGATKPLLSHSKKKPPSLPPPPSRLPNWTDATDDRATTGIFYKLDALADSQKNLPADSGTIKKPVVLLPEDVEASSGDYWAVPPAGQYKAANVLNDLVVNCYEHLRCKKPAYGPYLASGDPASSSYVTNLKRVYLCGHSGGGKPLGEACAAKIQTKSGTDTPPVDLWLFDCTYGFDIKNYIEFCKSRALGNTAATSRFVCVHRPEDKVLLWLDQKKTIPLMDEKTNQQAFKWVGTEFQADELRTKIAVVLNMKPKDLLIQHDDSNMSSLVIPTLLKLKTGALFIRTSIGHESIPTTFIPVLLRTAAN